MNHNNLFDNNSLSELSDQELINYSGGSVASDIGFAVGFGIGFAVGGGLVFIALGAKKLLT